MPERIETATIAAIDPDHLESDDRYPDAYGFTVRMNRDAGPEWGVEFVSVYEELNYPGKPPIDYRGETMVVFFLPRYAGEAGKFLRVLEGVVAETNRAVEQRNSVLPDSEKNKETLRRALKQAAQDFERRLVDHG